MDLENLPQFPAAFAEPLRMAVRGRAAVWPASMSADERAAIDAHGMGPLIRRMAGLSTLDEQLHDAAMESLRLVDLREVLGALAEAGVRPLILKGTALAYSIYDAPELRPRTDVDLLIAKDDLERAIGVLHALSFTSPASSGDELGFLQQSFARDDRHGLRHVYDVHLAITNSAVTAGALRYEEMLERAHPLPPVSAVALTLSDVDALLYAAIHRSVHHYDSGRLIWLYDVHLLRRRLGREGGEEVWRLAAERRLVRICRRTFELAEAWFGPAGPPATDFLDHDALARDEPSAAFLAAGRTRGSVLLGDLAALPGWRARLRRLRQLAFPPASYLLASSGTTSRSALPLLYALRALRGVSKLFRRVSGTTSRR